MLPRFAALRRSLSWAVLVLAIGAALFAGRGARAHGDGDDEPVESIVVYGRGQEQIGRAHSASEGRVSGLDLELRPVDRIGELLETVPGLIATQHSGGGKANQLYLRGFNLDHGTDFAAHFDGVPVNLRTHAHGQGYLDLNFVIPEIVASLDFRKGPYRAETGDFSSAGSSYLRTRDALPDSIAKLTAGEHDFVRGVVAANLPVETGEAYVALTGRYFDDPFRLDAGLKQFTGFAKWTRPLGDGTLRLSAQGYYGEWNSTDQVPRNAIETGTIPRLGFVDPDLGGETARAGLTVEYTGNDEHATRLATYLVYSRLELYANFTYFVAPDLQGDEFMQNEERIVWGAQLERSWPDFLGAESLVLRSGGDTRLDLIPKIGLERTRSRNAFATVRRDSVVEWSAAAWAELHWAPTDWMTWTAGARADLYVFDVSTRAGLGDATNGGREVDGLVSPKLGVSLRPLDWLEFYGNAGGGFHSNDARGTTLSIDPAKGTPAKNVDPLARQWGAEAGLRIQPSQRFHVTAAFWWLRSASELVFVGDEGTTEAQGASRRYGVEISAFARPFDWLALDASWAGSDASFTNVRGGQDSIRGALETVISAGATVTAGGFSASARLRHLGSYPLVESNAQRAGSTTLVNLRTAYDWDRVGVALTVVNLFDSKDSDVQYFYASRLDPGAAAPTEDVHLHPVAPRQLRATLTARF